MRKVPTIARPPIISGSSEATRLRKKSSESRKRSGKASSSAIRRSFSTCSLTCFWATAKPPTRTPGWAESCLAIAAAGVLHRLVAGRLQGDREVGRFAVARDEGGGVGVVVAGDRGDVRPRAPPGARARAPGPGSTARRPARSRPRRSPPARAARRARAVRAPARSRSPGRRRRRGPGGSRPSRRARRRGGRSRSRRARPGGRGGRRGGRARRTSAAPSLGGFLQEPRLHPLAPLGEPLGELDAPAAARSSGKGSPSPSLSEACGSIRRSSAATARRWARIERRISTASSRGRAPAKKSFSSPSSRIS